MKIVSSEKDLRPAVNTYNGFIGMVKWGSVAAFIVTALVVLLIAPK